MTLSEQVVGRGEGGTANLEIAKPQVFDGTLFVIATTHQNSTCSMLTSAKLTEGYLVVGITRELDKEPLLYCSSIYINTTWSVLQ